MRNILAGALTLAVLTCTQQARVTGDVAATPVRIVPTDAVTNSRVLTTLGRMPTLLQPHEQLVGLGSVRRDSTDIVIADIIVGQGTGWVRSEFRVIGADTVILSRLHEERLTGGTLIRHRPYSIRGCLLVKGDTLMYAVSFSDAETAREFGSDTLSGAVKMLLIHPYTHFAANPESRDCH